VLVGVGLGLLHGKIHLHVLPGHVLVMLFPKHEVADELLHGLP
jgi:hypothetical protein